MIDTKIAPNYFFCIFQIKYHINTTNKQTNNRTSRYEVEYSTTDSMGKERMIPEFGTFRIGD